MSACPELRRPARTRSVRDEPLSLSLLRRHRRRALRRAPGRGRPRFDEPKLCLFIETCSSSDTTPSDIYGMLSVRIDFFRRTHAEDVFNASLLRRSCCSVQKIEVKEVMGRVGRV
ncbi:hypothetical protein EVAR_37310_1 [Eumeta japonica]|uniref:Uncharacterized protein n=1 Tax=Eumeta variegata TaxID=151549 RepID=A0A4C1WXG9_EUMVA|nr:hypothetical protein EVAR_37310_1 [Eumeta japonica]